MSQIVWDISPETLLALKISLEEAGAALRIAAAAKFHELGQFSSGAAAELAGVPRVIVLPRWWRRLQGVQLQALHFRVAPHTRLAVLKLAGEEP